MVGAECWIDFSEFIRSCFHWEIFHQRVESRSNLSQAFIFFPQLNIWGGGSPFRATYTEKMIQRFLSLLSFGNSISWHLILNTLALLFTYSLVSKCVAQYLSC